MQPHRPETNTILQTPVWLAVYTRSRSEKRLQELLTGKGIEAYVPLRKVIHQWSDRRKWVDEPIIRSYCFVRVSGAAYFDVLNTPGAVWYVWFSGKPAVIPDRQIQVMKLIAGTEVEVECLPDVFQPGTRVRVNAGPLAGLTGELVDRSNRRRVLVRIDHLNQVLMLKIPPVMIERVSGES